MPTVRKQSGSAAAKPAVREPGSATTRDLTEECTIVAVGASAGGLEACSQLMDVLPTANGMAFILVQHLDPTHKSLLADLLSKHTAMTVVEAADGTKPLPDHLYIIPPSTYLALSGGALRLSAPDAPHGARLPFDFLLRSLAHDAGERAVCIVLSGTGADGSLGLKAIRERGGLVIAQRPEEAGYDGMPRSAIATGCVDLILPIGGMREALARHRRRQAPPTSRPKPMARDGMDAVVGLLRRRTQHDFTHYKPGTMQRRVDRRMAMAGLQGQDIGRYVELLARDPAELERLARDLLINVTGFFRDPAVFALLEKTIVPDLLGRLTGEQLRVWVAGCSTGEEAYSLAMLFYERIAESHAPTSLKVFASDADADAIARAREGVYPASIEADLSPERLARFFTREDRGYRVKADLRGTIVFTRQDVLSDPPFSRVDMVSCRNLLIYLQPDAQAQVLSHFHFALRDGGILLLGGAETVGHAEGYFEILSKQHRLYRRRAGGRAERPVAMLESVRPARASAPAALPAVPSRKATLADVGRRLVLDTFAPACVLINQAGECLYTIGPIDRYLRVPSGHQSLDLLAMARPGLRAKLAALIGRAWQERKRLVVEGSRAVRIDVQPASGAGQALLLVCFIEQPSAGQQYSPPVRPAVPQSDLEIELETTKEDLKNALADVEAAVEQQKTIAEETSSVNEEFQSTNEELLTSKEELQSLNEELTALNSQLQETLERQRTTSDDLQNVLYSTDVATLFLDRDLRIRFFTPASKSLFNILSGDVGRKLADLRSLANDGALSGDVTTVLEDLQPLEREIETDGHVWCRRMMPYRSHDSTVQGVVITFSDITQRKHAADALAGAKQESERANTAKSRFLAAASHDLRQPLQTLSLLQGLLAKIVEGDTAQKLVARMDETLAAMSGMLNTLLDINQIEAGRVQPEISEFPIADLLDRLRDEFSLLAKGQGLDLHVAYCSLTVSSDLRLLEQIIRNLLSNALKYTSHGGVLLGCRRRGGTLSVEIWDTGAGIPSTELQAIFDEYHQLDNPARERSRGLGLGLSIVQRLSKLLGHQVHVRSRPGKGSVFSIDGIVSFAGPAPHGQIVQQAVAHPKAALRTGLVLVIEDDPELRDLLQMHLQGEGHVTAGAGDGQAALEMVLQHNVRPDIVLADHNLPNGMDGLRLARKLRDHLGPHLPVIILTGDTSAEALRRAAPPGCPILSKPVTLPQLTQTIQMLLPESARHVQAGARDGRVFIVDDDPGIRSAIRSVLEDDGYAAETFATGEAFLEAYRPGPNHCLLVDAYLPGMGGHDVIVRLRQIGHILPAIMITGQSDVSMAVEAMKSGAIDFIEKPVSRTELLAGIGRALELAQDAGKLLAWRQGAADHLSALTGRQRDIMARVLAGHPSKNIAADLGISQRTVENHRAAIMRKTGSASLPALARLALAAGTTGEPAVQ